MVLKCPVIPFLFDAQSILHAVPAIDMNAVITCTTAIRCGQSEVFVEFEFEGSIGENPRPASDIFVETKLRTNRQLEALSQLATETDIHPEARIFCLRIQTSRAQE
jgi:hypothetical protein